MKMVRKQVYITKEQDEELKRLSKTLGLTEAELIRQAIDQSLPTRRYPHIDKQAWQEELKFLEKRAKLVVPQRGRTWTRDELYDD
jgi:hypothetical protein